MRLQYEQLYLLLIYFVIINESKVIVSELTELINLACRQQLNGSVRNVYISLQKIADTY